jgi:hypothetical protein
MGCNGCHTEVTGSLASREKDKAAKTAAAFLVMRVGTRMSATRNLRHMELEFIPQVLVINVVVVLYLGRFDERAQQTRATIRRSLF